MNAYRAVLGSLAVYGSGVVREALHTFDCRILKIRTDDSVVTVTQAPGTGYVTRRPIV